MGKFLASEVILYISFLLSFTLQPTWPFSPDAKCYWSHWWPPCMSNITDTICSLFSGLFVGFDTVTHPLNTWNALHLWLVCPPLAGISSAPSVGPSSSPCFWTGVRLGAFSVACSSGLLALSLGEGTQIHGLNAHLFFNDTHIYIYYLDPSLEFLSQKPNCQLDLTI